MNRYWQDVKALCDKATPEPWESQFAFHGVIYAEKLGYAVIAVNPIRGRIDSPLHGMREKDSSFIAAARTALPRAIALLEKIEAALEDCVTKLTSDWSELYHCWDRGDIGNFEDGEFEYEELVERIKNGDSATEILGVDPEEKELVALVNTIQNAQEALSALRDEA